MLVDEQFGGDVPREAKENDQKLAMPAEKSGQNEFDFQYGDDFGTHIEQFDPAFTKVLVRYNPDDPDTEMNKRQLERLEDAGRLAARPRPPVPLRAARAGHRRPARPGRRRHRPLRRRAASRADAPRDRGDPGPRDRGRHLEDRGRRRALRRGDARQADPDGRGPRERRLRPARPRRLRREGRPLAQAGLRRRRLHRLRHRPLDLVGRAQGLPRRVVVRARRRPTKIADNYLRFIDVYEGAAATA